MELKMKQLLFIFSILFSLSTFAEEKEIEITTKRGTTLKAILHTPSSEGPHPALIIAPGQGYKMHYAIIEELAKKASGLGLSVLRFNWGYMSDGGRQSEGYSLEKEDLLAVFDYLKNLSNIDKNNIILAGKSLGSIVSYDLFVKQKELKALLLITPVCAWPGESEEEYFPVAGHFYSELVKELRPVHLILGNKDPHCQLPMLYNFLKDSRGNVSVNVVGGNHSLNLGDWQDPEFIEINAKNISIAVDSAVHWIDLILKH